MTKRIIVIICCLVFIILAFADVNAFIDAGRRGVLLFGRNVMPVLFPFFFISGLLVEIGFFSGFRRFGKSVPIFALSLLSGYPTGARLLRDLYKRGEITREQAIRIATYTSTCSPIFVIATLGACFYQSAAVGVLIFAAHVLGAVVNGVIYRKVSFRSDTPSLGPCRVPPLFLRGESLNKSDARDDMAEAISNSLYSAVQNILAVGGLIIVFFIMTSMFGGGVVLSGLLEMTNGVFQASTKAPTSLLIPCAIISFGGLCVAVQGAVFMSAFRMPLWFYLLFKVTHMIFAVIICFVLSGTLL